MDIRSLRYFVETASLCSFTRAADKLHVTQSTISKMVRQLEDEIGTPLLLREGRRLTLTDTGRVVFERGQEMLASMRQLSREVRDTTALRKGRLALGIPPMINSLFTPALKAYRQRYPDIELALTEDTGQAIERQLAAGELEIGMTVLPTDPGLNLSAAPVASYPIWALGAPGTFRSGQRTMRLGALRDMPLVLLKDDFALTRTLLGKFAEAGFAPRIAAQSGHWDWLVSMASAGLGVALLPEPFTRRIADQPVDLLRVVEPDLSWEVVQVWRGQYQSHAALAWRDICREVLNPPPAQGRAGAPRAGYDGC